MIDIREETAGDREAVEKLNREAFQGEYEAALIGRLDAAGLSRISLVAVLENEIAGHILFSALPTSVDERELNALALGPMSVRPDVQRQGIGSKLIKSGLEIAAKRDLDAVIVLGHTDYYPKFGFRSELAAKLIAIQRGRLHGHRAPPGRPGRSFREGHVSRTLV